MASAMNRRLPNGKVSAEKNGEHREEVPPAYILHTGEHVAAATTLRA
jgi:hypothetical protein